MSLNKKAILNNINQRISELSYIKNGVELYGVKKFYKKIKELNLDIVHDYFVHDERERFCRNIFKLVAFEFKQYHVTYNKMLLHHKRFKYTKKVQEARILSVFLVRKNLDITLKDVSHYLGRRTPQSAARYLSDFEKLRKNRLQYKEFFSIMKRVQAKINKLKSVQPQQK